MIDDVRAAYSDRAAEYADLLGSMDVVHPLDRQLVADWAGAVSGPLIDVGCGPGHWTDFLARRGSDIRGIDPAAGFIDRARAAYPHLRFDLADAASLGVAAGSQGGLLAWYSLIHCEPDRIHVALAGLARALRRGGELLIGFVEGPELEPFDHAVVTAYRWPVPALAARVGDAGFEVIETHTRTGPDHRPHGAIRARRLDSGERRTGSGGCRGVDPAEQQPLAEGPGDGGEQVDPRRKRHERRDHGGRELQQAE